MKKEKNIIQFLPYFPPHVWGVEKVGEDIFWKWTYWKSFILSGNIWQEWFVYNKEIVRKQDASIRKKKLFFESFDIVDNFPFPKIWTKDFWKKWNFLKEVWEKEGFYIITHTRFFFSSFIGWIFARRYKCRWIHIEHGSDYVQLSSGLKNKIAYLYDRVIWKWIFKKADSVLCISEASRWFVVSEFWRKDAVLWHRGIDFLWKKPSNYLKEKFPKKIIIWYIGRLYKWKNVESLCSAYQNLPEATRYTTQLVIVWGGEEYQKLISKYEDRGVYFTGEKSFEESFGLQWEFDIHVHPSSPGWWLATTLLQAMHYGSMIVATPYEWAKEVIKDGVNGYVVENDSQKEIMKWIIRALENIDLQEEFAYQNKQILEEQFSHEKNLQTLYELL